MRRLVFFAAVVVLGFAGRVAFGGPIPPTFFGMHVKSVDKDWPPFAFGALGKGAGLTWAYVEPARGVFQWYGLDHYVAAAEQHGADSFYAFSNTPQWASARPTEFCYHGKLGCAAPPATIEYWDEFITALVTRYKGRIRFYEIWDEANASPTWSGTYAELAQLAQSAYKIIKTIDPNAIVLTPATTGNVGYQPAGSASSGVDTIWMTQYLRSGGSNYADAGNWHAYLMRTHTKPYRMPEDGQSPCYMDSWNYQKSCYGSILDEVDAMRAVFDRNGLSGKPMINSEGGWGENAPPDPELQSAWLARYYLLQAGKGVARVYWYGWGLDRWGSLQSEPSRLGPPGVAYQEVYRWLTGATVTGPCSAASDGSTWTCLLERSRGYRAAAIWNTSSARSHTPEPQYRRWRDLAGQVFPIQGNVMIGRAPILLETGGVPDP